MTYKKRNETQLGLSTRVTSYKYYYVALALGLERDKEKKKIDEQVFFVSVCVYVLQGKSQWISLDLYYRIDIGIFVFIFHILHRNIGGSCNRNRNGNICYVICYGTYVFLVCMYTNQYAWLSMYFHVHKGWVMCIEQTDTMYKNWFVYIDTENPTAP